MPLFPSPTVPLIGGYDIPAGKYIPPILCVGCVESTKTMNSFYAYFVPFFFKSPRVITELVFEVSTFATSSTIAGGAFVPRSTSSPLPGLQIANSAFTGVDSTSNGVKTVAFSPSWTAPAGLVWLVLKTVAASSKIPVIKAFTGGGRENLFFGGQTLGFATSPTTAFQCADMPVLGTSDAGGVLTDYTASAITYDQTSNFPAAFLK